MHYERIDKVYTAAGETVQVRFDLSYEQSSAGASRGPRCGRA
jgi:hypothetical protein